MSTVDADRGWRPGAREVDVCIVGAGAAGITLALELAASGHECLVLEGGDRRPTARSQSLYAGAWDGIPYELDTSRLRYLGGSTNHWTGICRPLDPIDFELRPGVPNSGWSMSYDDLASDYPRAEQLCELYGTGWEPQSVLATRRTQALPTDPARFTTAIFRNSPPTRFAKRYGDELRAADAITVVLNANVLGLRTDRAGTVRSVEVAPNEGSSFEVRAARVVLAMGGVENARFLLNAVDSLPNGPQLDWIGQCFMEHPQYFRRLALVTSSSVLDELPAYFPPPPGSPPQAFWATLATTPELRAEQQLLGCAARFGEEVDDAGRARVPPSEIRGAASLLRSAGAGVSDRLLWVELWTEQSPNRENRVTLTRARDRFGQRRAGLNWFQSELDLDSVARTVSLLGAEVARLGVGRVREVPGDIYDQKMLPASHHMGTTRMSASPDFGVVDETCRFHGSSNLYVAGSSVFATSGYANPTLTVVAMALRLARHVAGVGMSRISRRGFLARAAAGLAAASTLHAAVPTAAAERVLVGGPGSPFDDPAGIRALGRLALAEGHPRTLADEVAGLDAAALRAAITSDLAVANVLDVGGWTLARSEVAACIHEHLEAGGS